MIKTTVQPTKQARAQLQQQLAQFLTTKTITKIKRGVSGRSEDLDKIQENWAWSGY